MKVFTGTVISKKMDKTASVAVNRVVQHPLYGKRLKRSKTYHVHDENNTAKVGDVVRFVGTKPFSKTKRWALLESASKKAEEKKEVKPKKVRKTATKKTK